MKDIKAIISECKKIDFGIRKAALATVVKVYGSSYRSPGARMLIMDDGRWVGSISGGCLEGDALRKARHVMDRRKAVLVTYDTREESNQNLGIGLGCNGIIDVLIEPLEASSPANPVTLFESFVNSNDAVAMATIFRGDVLVGDKAIMDTCGRPLTCFTDYRIMDLVMADLCAVFKTKKSETRKYIVNHKEIEIFIEYLQPPITLIIFGAGFDARPVSELAKSLGWTVQVTDECVAHIAPVFFPGASTLKLCDRQFIEREFNITPYTACVLMSHNYAYDRDVLRKLIDTASPYIGILGPKKRADRMQLELEEQGVLFTPEIVSRIHSPIGLDIGAEAQDEIAIAIIAEIKSKFAGRLGGFLKYRSTAIHERDDETGQVFKQVYFSTKNNALKLADTYKTSNIVK